MRKLFLLITILSFSVASSQVAVTRVLDVKPGQMEKMMEGVAKKTKMFNSGADDAQWYTFQILSGANAQDLWRVQIAENIAGLDDVDTEGNAYWQKTVGDLHESGTVRRWGMANSASYTPELSELKPLTRALFFNFDPTKSDDFWNFRVRLANAHKEAGTSAFMETWWCSSGCDGSGAAVFYYFRDYADQMAANEQVQKAVDKYNELYGNDAYEYDLEKMIESLMPNGQKIRDLMFLPELSSPITN